MLPSQLAEAAGVVLTDGLAKVRRDDSVAQTDLVSEQRKSKRSYRLAKLGTLALDAEADGRWRDAHARLQDCIHVSEVRHS